MLSLSFRHSIPTACLENPFQMYNVIAGGFDICLLVVESNKRGSRIGYLNFENLGSIYLLDRVQMVIPFDMGE